MAVRSKGRLQRGNGCRGHDIPFSIRVAPGAISHGFRVDILNSAVAGPVRHTGRSNIRISTARSPHAIVAPAGGVGGASS
eukprot:3332227-Prymnesium_polylepis.1